MKATIKKSIGNTFLVEVKNQFYDLVLWKVASKYLKCRPILAETINKCMESVEIEIDERKVTLDHKLVEIESKLIDWIDKKRTLGDILNNCKISGSKILVTTHKYLKDKSCFEELENPKREYVLTCDGYDLVVKKEIFLKYRKEVEIIQKRCI